MPNPRARVIIDNDFAGDPDDLVQLVHHVLSTSVEIPFIIGSHLSPGDLGDPSGLSATHGADIAREFLSLAGREDIPVIVGSELALSTVDSPIASPAALAIIEEANRTDTDLPLYIAAGGGLTDVASALLIDERIGERITLVWIGGPEYPGFGGPAASADMEYNMRIDRLASEVVFDSRTLGLWQVPRDTYRQCLVSQAELDVRVGAVSELGRRLVEAIGRVQELLRGHGRDLGETYALGDSPLVLLTALQSAFEPDTSSSRYEAIAAPRIAADGSYDFSSPGREIRVYTRVDTRLMFEDLFHKLAIHASGR